jgi:hypothetical protein
VCPSRWGREERHGDGFIHPDLPVPHRVGEGLRLSDSGADKRTHRVFTAYMLQIESEVLETKEEITVTRVNKPVSGASKEMKV